MDAKNEKEKMYRENQKISERERRKKVKDALKEGQEDSLNLAFLRRIMRELGVNAAAMARAMGWAEQSVQWWLAVDDTKLSNVEAAVKALGYRLICSFELEEEINKPYKIIIDGMELLSAKTKKGILEEVAYSDRRLSFFAKAILEDGRRLSVFETAGHPAIGIYWCLQKDDMRISALYRYARILDRKVVWSLERAEGGNIENGGNSTPQREHAYVRA